MAYQRESDPQFGHVSHGRMNLVPVSSLQLCLALLANDDNAILLALCDRHDVSHILLDRP